MRCSSGRTRRGATRPERGRVTVPVLHWHAHPTAEQVARELAAAIARQARDALAARGRYTIVVPGGSTPRPLFERLRRIDTDWSRWQVFFTDERCAPRGDANRNDATARAAWLGFVPIPADGVRAIPAELGADAAAAAYARELAGIGRFDTTVLGLGEDGHTASLFPGDTEGIAPDAPDVVAVHGAPKPPPERVTLSARRLACSAYVALLVTGAGKRDAVARLRRGDAVPAAAVVPERGVDVWLDAAAAGA
ncbi:MAG: 6-phosphogluconolactonase [Gammaproteobacteria bacterium]|nr:6-phosphogluconolactonase [Gammaproteobacteria bacterium]